MEKFFPACRPESNPAGFPPDAAKYTQGLAKEPSVTECEIEPLRKACMSTANRQQWYNSYEGKMNVTVVPLLAVKFDGLYTRPPAAT
jgi:hypothetical protein